MLRTNDSHLKFPGRIIEFGEQNREIVRAIQRRLNEVGCGPVDVDGDFGSQTKNAVKFFQARSVDSEGQSLKIDGKIGSITWGALFNTSSIPPVKKAESRLLKRVLEIASSQIGVREKPPNSNRGPEVDLYQLAAGLNPANGNAWCVAFIFFCFEQAAAELRQENPMVEKAHVLTHWRLAGERGVPRIFGKDAKADPGLIKPGHIFAMAVGTKGQGHSGLVIEVLRDGRFKTIEGNSNEAGSREGIGVFARERKPSEINRGFIDYSSF